MSDLSDLYQQIIIDNSQHPHNFCRLKNPNYTKEGYNPLCGDHLTIYLDEEKGKIIDIGFLGSGCAISKASASIMTDMVRGKAISDVLELFQDFQQLITTGKTNNSEKLGKLMAFANLIEFPMRIKCATLAWHTLKAILLTKNQNVVSTE